MGRKYNPTPDEIEYIRQKYDGSGTTTQAIARHLQKYPTWYIKRQATLLGVTVFQGAGEPWTEAELDYLKEKYGRFEIQYIQRGLKRISGIQRSKTAMASTWVVCGNMSMTPAATSLNP